MDLQYWIAILRALFGQSTTGFKTKGLHSSSSRSPTATVTGDTATPELSQASSKLSTYAQAQSSFTNEHL
jgi:hypothetical protein